jgi:hypothetical protein
VFTYGGSTGLRVSYNGAVYSESGLNFLNQPFNIVYDATSSYARTYLDGTSLSQLTVNQSANTFPNSTALFLGVGGGGFFERWSGDFQEISIFDGVSPSSAAVTQINANLNAAWE